MIQANKDKLTQYELAKSGIRFPYDKPVPDILVTEIVQYALKENIEKEAAKRAKE